MSPMIKNVLFFVLCLSLLLPLVACSEDNKTIENSSYQEENGSQVKLVGQPPHE